MNNKDWFISRIGKTIYFDSYLKLGECKILDYIHENGIKIKDKNHAEYLFDSQIDFLKMSNHDFNYREVK